MAVFSVSADWEISVNFVCVGAIIMDWRPQPKMDLRDEKGEAIKSYLCAVAVN